MLQLTLKRVGDRSRFGPPIVISGLAHRELLAAQLDGEAEGVRLILEPAARNTAPAIALAALAVGAETPLLVMPSDQVVADVPAFHRAVEAALPHARAGWLVTFGITPDRPETGYGYIERATPLADGVYEVGRFVEKPDEERARAFLEQGCFSWNGGIFLFRAGDYLAALGRHAPEILRAAEAAMAGAREEGRAIFADARAFEASPSESIDYAVMEKEERVAVVPVDIGWSDIGSWDALYDLSPRDGDGNAAEGDVLLPGSRGCLVRSSGPKVVAAGVEDLIVLATGDTVLVMRRGDSQRVKEIAGRAG